MKSAFLQGQSINREIFLKPPKEAGSDKLSKLLITVYGLCDAPRAWHLKIKEVLEKSGMLMGNWKGYYVVILMIFLEMGSINFEGQIIN